MGAAAMIPQWSQRRTGSCMSCSSMGLCSIIALLYNALIRLLLSALPMVAAFRLCCIALVTGLVSLIHDLAWDLRITIIVCAWNFISDIPSSMR